MKLAEDSPKPYAEQQCIKPHWLCLLSECDSTVQITNEESNRNCTKDANGDHSGSPITSPVAMGKAFCKRDQGKAEKRQPCRAKQHEYDAESPQRRINYQSGTGLFHALHDG